MPLPNQIGHPTPAQAFELAEKHATLLRHLFNHPQFKYLEPPTAQIYKVDPTTEPALRWVADFVQNTYVTCVIPFLPVGATRKCKALGNPWAYADASYPWEWEWDGQSGALKDASGTVVEFPKLPARDAKDKVGDVVTRGFMTKKIVLENATDPKARLMIGGKTFDFGEDIKEAVRNLD
ncbi:hypothetical protein SLS62_008885 [Diatrype stigma]|uniref:Uncharacterized protein n=1 Tax=Diatrype stigma TaxID=117547 RepID=A0AAN9YKQ5_9PEZI